MPIITTMTTETAADATETVKQLREKVPKSAATTSARVAVEKSIRSAAQPRIGFENRAVPKPVLSRLLSPQRSRQCIREVALDKVALECWVLEFQAL